jgi:hypothetical protein
MLARLRQENPELKANLVYNVKLCLIKRGKENKPGTSGSPEILATQEAEIRIVT